MADSRITACSSCKAPIIFLSTATGKDMPTDAATVGPDDLGFDPDVHTSHFATCPEAAKHRKPRAPKRPSTGDMLADPIGETRRRTKNSSNN